jgi:hypothetical protein
VITGEVNMISFVRAPALLENLENFVIPINAQRLPLAALPATAALRNVSSAAIISRRAKARERLLPCPRKWTLGFGAKPALATAALSLSDSKHISAIGSCSRVI